MSIGSKVKIVASKRSYHENGYVGTIVGEQDGLWLVEFAADGDLMDYSADEFEEIEGQS
jgi:hypothetical protein